MNNQEKELLEYVEINSIAKNMENKETGKKETWVGVKFNDEYYLTTFPTPNSKEELEKNLTNSFKILVKKMNSSSEKNKWVEKEIVYEVCSEMFCGDNPCSCEE